MIANTITKEDVTVQLKTYLPKSLRQRLKQFSLDREVSATDTVRKALELYLNAESESA